MIGREDVSQELTIMAIAIMVITCSLKIIRGRLIREKELGVERKDIGSGVADQATAGSISLGVEDRISRYRIRPRPKAPA